MNYLENWKVLNKHLQKLKENVVIALLKEELRENKRPQFLLRLYGRYNTLRTKRERSEILKGKWQG